MKALIRRQGETILEHYDLKFIDWRTGAPMTNPGWPGGPYTLVNDYVPEDPADDFDRAPAPQEPVTEDQVQDTIVIDGVTYTRTS